MTGWLIGGALWVAALIVLAPRVGRALRRSRLALDETPGALRSFTDRDGCTWHERSDDSHLFDMHGSADGVYQGWTHSQVDRVHGPLTPATHINATPARYRHIRTGAIYTVTAVRVIDGVTLTDLAADNPPSGYHTATVTQRVLDTEWTAVTEEPTP